jgi:hypothetical protein
MTGTEATTSVFTKARKIFESAQRFVLFSQKNQNIKSSHAKLHILHIYISDI